MNRKIIMYMDFYNQIQDIIIFDCELIIKKNDDLEFFKQLLTGYKLVIGIEYFNTLFNKNYDK